MRKIIFLLIPLFFLTGCYNYQELNKLGIITATEINKVDNEFEITVQIVNPKKQTDITSANQPAFITYTSRGKTVHDAYRNLIQKTSRKIYAVHMQLLIIKADLAKEDMKSIFDFYFRNIEIRKEFYVLIDTTKDGVEEEILDILTPLTNLSSQNIIDTLESDSKFVSVSNLVSFNDLMDAFLDEHKEFVLPTIYSYGNLDEGDNRNNLESSKTSADLKIGNLAIFKGSKMLGVLSKQESITVNLLNNNANEILVSFKCDNKNYASAKVTAGKADINVDTDNMLVNIDVNGKADLTEYGCSDDLDNIEVINVVNDKLNDYFKNNIKDNILNINTLYNSDIYGIRNIVYKKDFRFYNTIKDNYYNDFFNRLDYNIKSNIKLITKGNLHGGTYEKREN